MVAFGKNKLVSIKLSKEEQSCILQYCQDLTAPIKNKITHATDETLYLMDGEADVLCAILCNTLPDIKNKNIAALFDGLIKRIPLSDDIFKHTEKYANQDCTDPEVSERIWDEIQEEERTAPDPHRGNLTPEQITRFQNYIWGDKEFPLQFNHTLSLKEVNQSIFFRNTKLFLNKLIEFKDEPTTTAKGNLNRKFVKLMFDQMEMDDEYRDIIVRCHKVLNEQDVRSLHIVRMICECAGVITAGSNKITVSEKYNSLLSEENAGEIYYLLFEAFFKGFNLSYLDRLPEVEGIQGTFDFSLYKLSVVCNEYQSVDDLYYEVFLPAIMGEIEGEERSYLSKELFLVTRIIKPLVGFGLLECKYKQEKYLKRIEQVRKTPLFDKFMSLNL